MRRQGLLLVIPAFVLSCSLVQRLAPSGAPPAVALPPPYTATPPSPPSQPPPLQASDELHRAAMRPEFVEDLELFPLAPRYLIEVEVRIEPDGLRASMAGRAQILFHHPGGAPLDELALMLWPNDPQYEGLMRLGAVRVDGAEVAPQPVLGDLAVRLPLPAPLNAGQSLEVSAEFKIGRAHV